ncbi:hypothetical protein CYY_004158 [Polysphondylium violaceum]|uniref:FNIP repeat-containing protein n=1 Tax=Polysphondylium violaceum TaxID=133409 RepID=A0A8J4Q5X1_9MYCE|nr:hypothetical protein CYY_004158 [Polysphondylium violaceum]
MTFQKNNDYNELFYKIWRNVYLNRIIYQYIPSLDIVLNTASFSVLESQIESNGLKNVNLDLKGNGPLGDRHMMWEIPKCVTKLSLKSFSTHALQNIILPNSVTQLDLTSDILWKGFIPVSCRALRLSTRQILSADCIPKSITRLDLQYCPKNLVIPSSVVHLKIMGCDLEANVAGFLPNSIKQLFLGFKPANGFIPNSVENLLFLDFLMSEIDFVIPLSVKNVMFSFLDAPLDGMNHFLHNELKELTISTRYQDKLPFLPSGLTKLNFTNTPTFSIDKPFPVNLKTLILSEVNNQIKVGTLPMNLEELSIDFNFDLTRQNNILVQSQQERCPLMAGSIPRTVKNLSLKCKYLEFKDDIIPRDVEILSLSTMGEFKKGCIPSKVSHLCLRNFWKESHHSLLMDTISKENQCIIPTSVTVLIIGLDRYFIRNETIPQSVTHLKITTPLYQTLETNCISKLPLRKLILDNGIRPPACLQFPLQLTHLSFCLESDMEALFLPCTITHLHIKFLSQSTHQPIPESVIYLRVEHSNTQSMVLNPIPHSIQYLDFTQYYCDLSKISKEYFSSNIKHIRFNNNVDTRLLELLPSPLRSIIIKNNSNQKDYNSIYINTQFEVFDKCWC